ncbi:hypothetical protein [Curtobacterium sp. PhB115]|uniref:hypothetical protein n=1 Tax=Curtobacterium sp. PhB115 TaxID=2485173 RepID=UPI000F9655F1|nr:hypothetical protein [Curtobacterium sp. PhB115]ROP65524.1 hypothetical protein EDF19_2569 [Curtobacterium sp. PhB115]
MDKALRAPWRAVLRIALLGIGTLAALVLLSLVFGARPASASVVDELGKTVHGVTNGVGGVVGGVVDPVRNAVAPTPAKPAPAAPAPAPAAPSAPAPAPAPAPAASAPAHAPAAQPAAPAAPAPSSPAPAAAPAPAAPAQPATTAPAAAATTHPTKAVVDTVSRASRPLTDTVANVLRPVTGTVESVTDARPVTAVVGTVDHVVGGVPVVGSVLGDDTLGTVTGPVTGLVDDTLSGVGTTVGSVPDVVTGIVPAVGETLPGGSTPVIDIPSLPVGGTTTPPPAPAGSVPTADAPGGVAETPSTGPRSGAIPGAARSSAPATTRHADSTSTHVSSSLVIGPLAGGVIAATVATGDVQDATLGGRALLVPEDGDGHPAAPFDGHGVGVLGGTATSTSGGVAAVGIVGSSDDQFSLAAGSRGSLSDDVLPASVVGEHDVAPD